MTAVRKELRRRRKTMWSATTLVALVSGLVLAVGGGASINGSPFQAEDGNLVCTGGNPDWACVTEARKADKDTPGVPGPDDSFGQGTKEDTPVPTVVSGSIPPNKSDLKFFGVYKQAASATSGPFMELYWTRVQEPSGTTNMDFEFNQSSVISENGVTPVRVAGDLLIQYDLERGGTRPTLFASRWVTSGPSSQCVANNATPCWGNTTASGLPPRVNLTAAGVATGSINTTAIAAADSDGLGALSARTFGEAEVDLAAFGGGANSCITFGSAYLKSRASNSFPAELKDFIAPEAINVGNCGSVHIRKITNPVTDPADVQFGYTKTFATDPATPGMFTLGHGQSSDYVNIVLPGAGSVNEDVLPANWQFTSVDCSASSGVTVDTSAAPLISWTIDSPSDVVDCTYTNTLLKGAIKVTKLRKHAADGPGDHPQEGVNFTVDGVTVATDANGVACFGGLDFGTYTVHEEVPFGYHVSANDQQVTVDNNATCLDSPYGGETVGFHNTPLTDVTLSVDSQIDGGTASVVTCNGVETNTDANGDVTVSIPDLEPTAPAVTVTCTVVVDP